MLLGSFGQICPEYWDIFHPLLFAAYAAPPTAICAVFANGYGSAAGGGAAGGGGGAAAAAVVVSAVAVVSDAAVGTVSSAAQPVVSDIWTVAALSSLGANSNLGLPRVGLS